MRVSGEIDILAVRSDFTQETSKSFDLPLIHWRVWDAFGRLLPDYNATGGLIAATYAWEPTLADSTFFVADKEYRVVAITTRVEVAGTGGACTAVIKKAASATDIASGTALHSGSINLVGTVDTDQTITLSTTSSDLDIAAGTALGIDLTGTPTSARGTVTVFLIPASTDDLGIKAGAFATGCPYITTGDVRNTSTTRYARAIFELPLEYVDQSTITIRAPAGMVDRVATISATIDFEAYLSNRDTLKSGSDLVATSALDINSMTFADKDFSVTGLTVYKGKYLDVRMAIAVNDASAASPCTAGVPHIEALLTVQG